MSSMFVLPPMAGGASPGKGPPGGAATADDDAFASALGAALDHDGALEAAALGLLADGEANAGDYRVVGELLTLRGMLVGASATLAGDEGAGADDPTLEQPEADADGVRSPGGAPAGATGPDVTRAGEDEQVASAAGADADTRSRSVDNGDAAPRARAGGEEAGRLARAGDHVRPVPRGGGSHAASADEADAEADVGVRGAGSANASARDAGSARGAEADEVGAPSGERAEEARSAQVRVAGLRQTTSADAEADPPRDAPRTERIEAPRESNLRGLTVQGEVRGAEPAGVTTRAAGSAQAEPSALAARVAEIAERLENQPPPRQMTVEIGELRLSVSVRGDASVRVSVLSALSASEQVWRSELAHALEARGFSLQDETSDRSGRHDPRDPSSRRPAAAARSGGAPPPSGAGSRRDTDPDAIQL